MTLCTGLFRNCLFPGIHKDNALVHYPAYLSLGDLLSGYGSLSISSSFPNNHENIKTEILKDGYYLDTSTGGKRE